MKTTDNGPEDQEVERIKEVADAYHVYQRILLENGVLDFGDLINYCLRLFKKRPLILKKYREKFKYILVDEFQDTNWSQYELIKLLALPLNNLTVCADDDQAIYQWRGASFSRLEEFSNDFPNAEKVSLIVNYRSPQNILDQSYNFIKQNNPDRLEFRIKINKKLTANIEKDGTIEHIHAKNLDFEVNKTIQKIQHILEVDKEASYNDFAILVRANDSAIPFVRALERAGLPYQFLASRGLYSKPIILDIISYFKLLDNYHEGIAAYRILGLPFLKIPDTDIANITQYSYKKTKSLFESLNELSLIPNISKQTHEKVVSLLGWIKKHTAESKEKSVSELLINFLNDSGYIAYISDDKEKFDLINQFLKKIKQFEDANLDPSLKNFMEQINLELEAGEEGKLEFDPEKGPDMIRVMTIHGAKGLEFKYVFIVNMVDKRFPSISRKDPIELPDELIKDIKPTGDVHLQEERRLCYVAMTRAKKGLYFTSAEDYGGQRKKKLSRFLTEMNYEAREPDNSDSRELLNKGSETKIAPTKKKKMKYDIPDHFSFSQLSVYEKCPLQYKFQYILKIPQKGKPFFSFGSTIHNTLQKFLLAANKNNSKNQEALFGDLKNTAKESTSGKFSFKFIKDLYEKNWIDEWYDSKKEQEDFKKKGEKMLKRFYEDFVNNPPELMVLSGQIALEMPFNLKIGGTQFMEK